MGAIMSMDSPFYREARLKQYVAERDPDTPRAYVGKDGHIYCDFDNKRCHYTLSVAEANRCQLPYGDTLEAYHHQCGYWHLGHRR